MVQRVLEAAQPEASGECGPWALPGVGTARNCSVTSALGATSERALLLSLWEQDSRNTLGLKGLNYLECTGVYISSSCAHIHTCVLESLYKVGLLPCSVRGLWQDVPFGLWAFCSWSEQISAPSLCCTFKNFTGCYVDCECSRRQIGCSCVLVLLTFWVTFFFNPAKFKY